MDPTEASITLPEERESVPPPALPASETTESNIEVFDLASPPAETSDFAIAFPRDEEEVPSAPTPAPREAPRERYTEPTLPPPAPASLGVAASPAVVHAAPTATPVVAMAPSPPKRSLWPVALGLGVVLLAAGAAGLLFLRAQTTDPVVTATLPIAPVLPGSLPTTAAPVVPTAVVPSPPTEVAPPAVVPTELAPTPEVAPVVPDAAPPVVSEVAPPPSAPGVHLPLAPGEPIEGVDAEFDLARLGIEPVVDPGGRRATHRRIERLLSNAYRERGRGHLDEAERDYRSVLALDAENPRATSGLSLVGANREDHVTAVLFARRFVRLRAYPNNFVFLGERYLAGGDVASARRAFERALELEPGHREARRALAALP